MKAISQTRSAYDLVCVVASFGMSFLRLGVALFLGLNILNGSINKEIVIAGILLIMIFDYYDGFLFNKSFLRDIKWWRVNRRILDSVSDRLVIQLVCIPMIITHNSFLWIYIAILSREIALSVYTGKQLKSGILVCPGPIAKAACAMVGITTIVYLVTNVYLAVPITIIMLIASVLSFKEYFDAQKEYEKNYNIFSNKKRI